MYTRDQILQILKNKKKDLELKYSISEIGIFGSCARNDFNENSDIDILVNFSEAIDAFKYISLAHELQDIFKQKVDVVSRPGIKPQYLPYVEKNLIHV